jgi:hypothetical protein
MRHRHLLFLALIANLPILLLANTPASGNTTARSIQPSQQDLMANTSETININGDLLLSPEQNENLWNAHSVGLTEASDWKITFTDKAEMRLKTTATEAGHIATGAWWTTSFKTKQKLPMYTSKPANIAAGFRINILNADLNSGNEWLRAALACAIQRTDGSVVYTEMDLWDSPRVLAHPSGNVRLGGDIVYQGGDVVEYKVDQAATGQWRSYTLNLTQCINDAWQIKPGDLLESVYFVVEAAGAVNVTVKADFLLIVRLD